MAKIAKRERGGVVSSQARVYTITNLEDVT